MKKKKACRQIQLKLPFELPDVEVEVMPFDIRCSKHLEAHGKGIVDIPEEIEENPIRRQSVGPDLKYLEES